MSDSNKKNLEHINVQQVGKNDLKKTLKHNAYKIALESANNTKKRNGNSISKDDVEEAIKQHP